VKLFGKPPVRRELVIGHCYEDELLDAARAEAQDRHIGAAMTVLRECRDDPETRMLRVKVLGDCLFGYGDQVAQLGRERNDPDLLLVAGQAYVAEAWAILGNFYLSAVSHRQRLKFGATLQLALSPLMAASELVPDDAVVWATLLTVARGLGFTREEQDAIWAETVKRAPYLYGAHWARLHTVSENWYGSREEMLGFAVETARSAPPGNPVTAMVPCAYFALFGAAVSETRGNHWRLAARMFRAAAVPIAEASRKWLQQDETPHPRSYEAHNMFAGACGLAGDKERAVVHLRGMQDRLAPWPWSALAPDPADAYYRLAAKFDPALRIK
jgi:hypothetical protein